jgi:SOS response regulatory protein OraA/RecX
MNRRKPEEITDPEELRSMALRKCGELLKSQDYTEQRLRMKLQTAGFPEDTIDTAVEAMKEAHYIDDRRYAENYVKYHLKDRSRRRIKQDLQERGVAEEIIQESFQTITETAEEEEGAGETVSPADEAEITQIKALLRKKQYDPETAGWRKTEDHGVSIPQGLFTGKYSTLCLNVNSRQIWWIIRNV